MVLMYLIILLFYLYYYIITKINKQLQGCYSSTKFKKNNKKNFLFIKNNLLVVQKNHI